MKDYSLMYRPRRYGKKTYRKKYRTNARFKYYTAYAKWRNLLDRGTFDLHCLKQKPA